MNIRTEAAKRAVDFAIRHRSIFLPVATGILGMFVSTLFSKQSSEIEKPIWLIALGVALLMIITIILYTVIIAVSTDMNSNIEEIKEQVKIFSAIESIGIQGATPRHTEEEWSDFFAGANRNLRILNTYISSLEPLPKGIFTALRSGAKLQLLLLDPKSPIMLQRLEDIGLPRDIHVHEDAMTTMRRLLRRHNWAKGNIEVRVYKRIPPFTMYQADKQIRIGMFWHGAHSGNGAHIFVSGPDTPFGESITGTFEEIWSSATPIELFEETAPNHCAVDAQPVPGSNHA